MTDDLEFSGHVRKQMARRNIPDQAIYDVIGDADDEIERDDGAIEYTKIWNRRKILVVVNSMTRPRRVITVVDLGRGGR